MQSDYTSPATVIALLNVSSDGVPGDLWRAVRAALPTWEPVESIEAATILAEARTLIHDPLTDGQPPTWQWNLSDNLDLLQRIASGEHVAVIQVLQVVRLNLIAHRWHVDQHGRDRFAEIRWRFIDMLGRLLMDLEPTDWERELIELRVGLPTGATAGELIKRRRLDRGLTQIAVAEQVGVVRYTVGNWERGQTRPTLVNAVALTGILGGQPTDYMH